MPPTPDFSVDPESQLSLVEMLNRVLDRGAVISGDIVISVAGVDLVYVGLRVMLASVESMIARELRDAGAAPGSGGAALREGGA
jgi:hypothetical protein